MEYNSGRKKRVSRKLRLLEVGAWCCCSRGHGLRYSLVRYAEILEEPIVDLPVLFVAGFGVCGHKLISSSSTRISVGKLFCRK